MSRYVYPALTTVGQSIVQLGETAAELYCDGSQPPTADRSTHRDAEHRVA
jgi:DNA-binding LacI/PurR family transcriptional regulator